MAEERGTLDSKCMKETLQYLYKSGYAVAYVRLIGAAKPEQLQRDYAMAGGER